MAGLNPNFTTSQSAGTLSTMTITDTSTGADGTLTGRLIYCQKFDGNFLVPNGVTTTFIAWPLSQLTLNVANLLDKDYCLNIIVYWFSGSTITYSKPILTLFTGYTDVFELSLTTALSANNIKLTQDNFWYYKNKLRCLEDDAIQAVTYLNDQTKAQFCMDEAKKITDQLSIFF